MTDKTTILSVALDRLEQGLECASELDECAPEQLEAEGLALWLNLGSNARQALRRLDAVATEEERLGVLNEIGRTMRRHDFRIGRRTFREANAQMHCPSRTEEEINAEADRLIAAAGFAGSDTLGAVRFDKGPETGM
ncbi:hypothetical protein SAE02_77520 [Skermanella aerolata]|uniref:Uncharacterized protein n=1 Tax=Skermanella aerolata TaxID=393310 RepID=A0A512E4E3_9PROT|nr:hypothetical protein [Skermanella aerolata]KJB89987.1 hypothetical protein N826_08725 [Skermanella aerolata KACC 11604]GEO43604.1 hypothetical protein SAE02_77520 [Skermanella aerolata]